jgi:hypothetical protein
MQSYNLKIQNKLNFGLSAVYERASETILTSDSASQSKKSKSKSQSSEPKEIETCGPEACPREVGGCRAAAPPPKQKFKEHKFCRYYDVKSFM